MTKIEYNSLRESGMMWEFYPEFTGSYEDDVAVKELIFKLTFPDLPGCIYLISYNEEQLLAEIINDLNEIVVYIFGNIIKCSSEDVSIEEFY